MSYAFYVTVLLSLFLTSMTNPIGPVWLMKPLQPIFQWSSEASRELRLFTTSLKKYQQLIQRRVEDSFEEFTREQNLFIDNAKNRLSLRFDFADGLYNASISALETQKKNLDELNKLVGPKQITYDSLDQFRKEFNNSLSALKFPEMPTVLKKRLSKGHRKMKKALSFTTISDLTKDLEAQQNLLRDQLRSRYNLGDKMLQDLMSDISKFQDESNKKAKTFLNESLETVLQTMNKRDLMKQQRELTMKYKALKTEFLTEVEKNLKVLENGVKSLQETLSNTNILYEELMNKRKNSVYYASLNDYLLNRVLNFVDPCDKGWSLIKVENGVEVYQKFVGGAGGKIACVKSTTVINASPEKILDLLIDNNRVHLYNSLVEPGTMRDVEVVGDNTVVKWVRASPMFPFKTRDFCTLYHTRKLKDGSIVVLSSATKHPEAPETSEYCRASVILGANIIEPFRGNARKSKLTMLSQVDPGGIIPVSIVNKLCANGPIGFFGCVEKVVGA